MEADTNASTRNPHPIPVTWPIRRMKELVLVGRIVLNNIYFLFLVGGWNTNVVTVRSRRTWMGFLIRQCRQGVTLAGGVLLLCIEATCVCTLVNCWRRIFVVFLFK